MPLPQPKARPTKGRKVKRLSAFDARLLVAAVERRQGGIKRCLYCLTGTVNGNGFCDLTCRVMAESEMKQYAVALGATIKMPRRAAC